MLFIGTKRALLGGGTNPSAASWAAQVVTDGGSISGAFLKAASSMAKALQAGGAWPLMDYIFMGCGENSAQVLRDFQGRRQLVAHNSPTYVPNRCVIYNGTSNYHDSAFNPSTMAVAMTGTNMGAGVYEVSNVASGGEDFGVVISASVRLELTARSSGGVYFGNFNSANMSGATVADSSGFTEGYQATGSVCGFRKNGADAGTVSPGGLGSTLPNGNIYIGCRNNGGPQSYGARSIALAYFGAPLGSVASPAAYNAFVNFLTAIGALTTYTDGSSGSDGGTGAAGSPWQTWDKLYTGTPSGGLAEVAGSGTLTASSSVTVGHTLTVQGVTSRASSIAGNGQSRVQIINPGVGATVLFRGLTIDASLNTGGASGRTFDISAGAFYFNVYDCLLKGWKGSSGGYGIYAPAAGATAFVTVQNSTFSSDTVVSAIAMTQIDGGGLVTANNIVTLTNQELQSYGGFIVLARSPGCIARSTNDQVTITLDATLGGAVVDHQSIYYENVANASITGGTFTLDGASTTHAMVGPQISYNSGHDTGGCTISGSVISGCTVSIVNANGGELVVAGGDSGDYTKSIGLTITGCSGTGDATYQTGAGHGLFLGNVSNSLLTLSTVDMAALGLIDKLGSGNTTSHCTATRCTSAYGLLKGTLNPIFVYNTLHATGTYTGDLLRIEDNQSTTFTTGAVVQYNTFIADGCSVTAINVLAGCSGTYGPGNTYNAINGGSIAFEVNGSAVTPAAWQAQYEPTATGNIF